MILVSSMPSLEKFFRCFQRCEQGRTHGLPISHQLRQFGVTIACQQLDRVGGHDRQLEINGQGLMTIGPRWTKGLRLDMAGKKPQMSKPDVVLSALILM